MFKFSVDSHTYTNTHTCSRYKLSLQYQEAAHMQEPGMEYGLAAGCEQLEREREREKEMDSMGWDRIVHRGLRNKWFDSPAAILFRLHDKAFK